METTKSRYVHIKTEEVRLRGESLRVTIPSEVVSFLGLHRTGGKISFFKDTKQNAIIIVNKDRVKLFIEGFEEEGALGFSVSGELMNKVLDKER